MRKLVAFPVLLSLLALAGVSAVGAELQVREIKVGDKVIQVIIYRGQRYRKIGFGEFNDQRLAGYARAGNDRRSLGVGRVHRRLRPALGGDR